MNDQYCKQIYVNGKPVKLYDESAHDSIDLITDNITDIANKTNKNDSKLANITDENDPRGTGVYLGKLLFGIPSTQGDKYVDLNGQEVQTGTSVEGSGIPYFVYEKLEGQDSNDYRLHIKFR